MNVASKEFTGLQKQLQEELRTRVVDTAEFCAECQIDMPLFFRLLPAKGSWEWLGERKATVYSTEFWQEMKTKLQKGLKESEFPVEPRKLLQGSGAIPAGFVAKVVADLVKRGEIEGLVEGSVFVPGAYVQRRQQALVQELRDEGVIGTFQFLTHGLRRTQKLTRFGSVLRAVFGEGGRSHRLCEGQRARGTYSGATCRDS